MAGSYIVNSSGEMLGVGAGSGRGGGECAAR